MKNEQANGNSSICPVVVGEELAVYLTLLRRTQYSPNTINVYRRALLDLDTFLVQTSVRRVEDITPGILSDYRLSLVERGFRPASQTVYLRAVRGMFRMLEAERRIFINPALGITVRHEKRPIQRVPTEQEIRDLLGAPNTSTCIGLRDRAILETAYATGARRAELASATLSSVDLAERTMRLMGKGRRERVVPLTLCASEWLGRYIRDARPKLPGHDTNALWLGKRGSLSTDGFGMIFVVQSKKAQITPVIRPHAVRRACATHMLRNGASPFEIQQLLGHASLLHLSQYLAVSIRELKQAHQGSRMGD